MIRIIIGLFLGISGIMGIVNPQPRPGHSATLDRVAGVLLLLLGAGIALWGWWARGVARMDRRYRLIGRGEVWLDERKSAGDVRGLHKAWKESNWELRRDIANALADICRSYPPDSYDRVAMRNALLDISDRAEKAKDGEIHRKVCIEAMNSGIQAYNHSVQTRRADAQTRRT